MVLEINIRSKAGFDYNKERTKRILLKNFFQKYYSLITYGFFGVCSTLINIIMYDLLAHHFLIPIIGSTVGAWIVAVIFAYITNRIFVFQSKTSEIGSIVSEALSFIGCRFGTEVIDIAMMFVGVSVLKINDMFIKVIANIVIIVLNYVASKFWIFKTNEDKSDLPE